MELENKVIAAVSAVVALGILTYGIFNLTSSSASSQKKKSLSTKKKSNSSTPTSSTKKSQRDAADEDQDLSLRGYKKTSTGKTTTYFHRELTAEEKLLLGDQTPKRIDSPATAAAILGSSPSPNPTGGSVWNSAGTYEEKNISDWSQSTLRKKLKQLRHSIAGGQVKDSARNAAFPSLILQFSYR
jgi:hypothetical protein